MQYIYFRLQDFSGPDKEAFYDMFGSAVAANSKWEFTYILSQNDNIECPDDAAVLLLCELQYDKYKDQAIEIDKRRKGIHDKWIKEYFTVVAREISASKPYDHISYGLLLKERENMEKYSTAEDNLDKFSFISRLV